MSVRNRSRCNPAWWPRTAEGNSGPIINRRIQIKHGLPSSLIARGRTFALSNEPILGDLRPLRRSRNRTNHNELLAVVESKVSPRCRYQEGPGTSPMLGSVMLGGPLFIRRPVGPRHCDSRCRVRQRLGRTTGEVSLKVVLQCCQCVFTCTACWMLRGVLPGCPSGRLCDRFASL